jgi:hypothetical protein
MNVDNWTIVTKIAATLSLGALKAPLGDIEKHTIEVEDLDIAIALAMKLGCHTVEARRSLVTALVIRRLRAALIDEDYAFLSQVVSEAEKEGDAILAVSKPEIQQAIDLLTFRDVMSATNKAMDSQDESALVDSLARAARLGLAEHPRSQVRQTIEAATLALGRIQRCKAALAAGIKTLEVPMLIDALAMAGSIGYRHPLVDEARRVLVTVQALIDRSSQALRNMDAVQMASTIKDCDAIGLSNSILVDIRRSIALPRGEFLRRELAAVLSLAASGSTPVAHHVPLADGVRAPTAMELRVIQCTLQLKDLFFADAPEIDESALLGYLAQSPLLPSADGSTPSFLAHSSAAGSVSVLQQQKNADDNVRGALQRSALPSTVGGFAWALAGDSKNAIAFRPSGSGLPAPAFIGGTVPPVQSKLRRQFELAKAHRLKPPHMFSRKFGVAESTDSLLRWQHEPIHTSLTMLQDADHRRLAVKCFRDLLAFMGDRPLARPISLAQDILHAGSSTIELRDEIFLQLCKQLSSNPSASSLERGWVLMHLCLCTFPPSEDLENHLELFLRERGALACVWGLHLTLYRGGPGFSGVPTADDVQSMLDWARAPALPSLSFDLPSSDADALSPSKDRYIEDASSPFKRQTAATQPAPFNSSSSGAHAMPSPPPPPSQRFPTASTSPNKDGLAASIEQRLASIQSTLSSVNL